MIAPPTMYFKVKVHKPNFQTKEVMSPGLFEIKNTITQLAKLVRPIANHKPSITTLVSTHLRPLIKPIINNAPFLCEDVHEVIDALGHPSISLDHIHTYDIKSYTSTPHQLILEAFEHYNPMNPYYRILEALLPLNFITDGFKYYTLGQTGIPMGLPLAPELARMCTAYLLLNYSPPPNHTLTLYFDDLASTYPLPMDILKPFTLDEGQLDMTQDALYDAISHSFIQITHNYKQPTPLHIASNHPSQKMLQSTWRAATLRSARIATEPKYALDTHLKRYMPHYMRTGHHLSELAYAIADLMYFPANTPKNPPPETTGITYNYSQTRPTKRQLALLTKQDFHLVPKIPLHL